MALPNSRDAFAARLLLAQAAERSLDVQFCIWRNDLSGTLLFDALREAADRAQDLDLDNQLKLFDSQPDSREPFG